MQGVGLEQITFVYIEDDREPVKAFQKKRVRVRAETFCLLQGGRTREGGGTEAVLQKTLSVRLRSIELFPPPMWSHKRLLSREIAGELCVL